MEAARGRAQAEAVRLMYVGLTRARDCLILAARPCQTAWLDALTDAAGNPILAIPAGEGAIDIRVGEDPHPAVARILTPPEEVEHAAPPALPAWAAAVALPLVPPIEHPPLRVAPSQWNDQGTGQGIGMPNDHVPLVRERIGFGGRLPIPGGVDMARLGEAMHAFLAIDQPETSPGRRLAGARGVLERWTVPGMAGETLMEAGDRLWRILAHRWPRMGWHTEVPVQGRLGLQRVAGRIDLLLDTPDGAVILDHKSFPGSYDHWTDRALSHAPQLSLYRHLVEAATGRPVVGVFIHMPVVGILLEIH
ncbi:PD-(D/E)XK nuclease superfamily protein [Azospirillum lipoferum]|nr:PD-(D/E)XK nuclease superfamily protein [Azospirillum lipoferum]